MHPVVDQPAEDYKRHLVADFTARALRLTANRAAAGPPPGRGRRGQGDHPGRGSVNGTENARDWSALLLIHFLRDELGLTEPLGLRHLELRQLLAPLDAAPVNGVHVARRAMADGRSVRTVEGLEQDGKRMVQEGFIECHGLQCGFCTPGMMMTRWLLDHYPDPAEAEIREAISGQICRCTGYENNARSVGWAAKHPGATTQAAGGACPSAPTTTAAVTAPPRVSAGCCARRTSGSSAARALRRRRAPARMLYGAVLRSPIRTPGSWPSIPWPPKPPKVQGRHHRRDAETDKPGRDADPVR